MLRKVPHPAGDAPAPENLASPGGCRAGRRQRLSPTPAPFTCVLVHVWTEATHRVERSHPTLSRSLAGYLGSEPPLDLRSPFEVKDARERLGDFELPTGLDQRVVDDLAQ